MEGKGILKGVSLDWSTGKFRLTFEMEQDVSSQLDAVKDKPLRITAKQWKEKRSLDANAYYWVLLSKLAELMKISKPRAHNIMLRRYGQPLIIDGPGPTSVFQTPKRPRKWRWRRQSSTSGLPRRL